MVAVVLPQLSYKGFDKVELRSGIIDFGLLNYV